MRVLQIVAIYPSYAQRLDRLSARGSSFDDRIACFLADRYGSAHILQPILEGAADAFLSIGNDQTSQRQWAREHGLDRKTTGADILLAQIEHHQPDVIYNLDPITYGNAFLARLPGCVRRTVAWRAAPSPHLDFFDHDLIVSNFPSIRRFYEERGARTAEFWPGHDPELDHQARKRDRATDVLFVGGFTQHHRNRAALLEKVARLAGRISVVLHLDASRLSRLAETPLGIAGPLSRLRRPRPVASVSQPPVFGRELHEALGSARIVLNSAIDMAGPERGNMRCFEALGAGCLMISDEGIYPPGFEHGTNFLSYRHADDAVATIERALEDWPSAAPIAARGHDMVAARYSKARQWRAFQALH